jgi:tetratricopeptide (TPR) repeat protein
MKQETKASGRFILCQKCRAVNEIGLEFCSRCGTRLLIVKGMPDWDEKNDGFSMDVHLLERISSLEEAIRKQEIRLDVLLDAVQRLERGVILDRSGLLALMEVLKRWHDLDAGELTNIWEENLRRKMVEIEFRDSFLRRKSTILSLFHGKRRAGFENLLNACGERLSEGNLPEGIEMLKRAAKHDPMNPELLFCIGDFHYRSGEPEKAKAFLRKSLRARPSHLPSLLLLGYLAFEEERLGEAEELFSKAARTPGANHIPLVSLAFLHARLDDYDRALDLISTADCLLETPEALALEAYILLVRGKTAKAVSKVKSSLAMDRQFDEAHYLLGLCYLQKNQIQKAKTYFLSQPVLAPFEHDLSLALRAPLFRWEMGHTGPGARGSRTKAETATPGLGASPGASPQDLPRYIDAMRREPENPVLLQRFIRFCVEFEFTGHAREAVDYLLRLSLAGDDAAWTKAVQAFFLQQEGKAKAARRILIETLERTAGRRARFLLNYELARQCAEDGHALDGAISCADEALQTVEKPLRPATLAVLGWIHFKKGAYAEAARLFSESQALKENPVLLFFQGVALLSGGNAKGALPYLMEAFRECTDFFHLHRVFGEGWKAARFPTELDWMA